MEVKIKQGNEMINSTIEMVDGVMVVSPKEVKFEPKDGDVVTFLNGGKPTIYIYKGGYKYNTSYYAACSTSRNQVLRLCKDYSLVVKQKALMNHLHVIQQGMPMHSLKN